MGGLMARKQRCHTNGDNAEFVHPRSASSGKILAKITEDEGPHCSSAKDDNANYIESSKRLIPELPLADKRVTVEQAQALLLGASKKTISGLMSSNNAPNILQLSQYDFPFENAVFEGGGVKGISYIGAIKCLEDVGIRLQRFAGASIGASVAGLLSVGFSSEELIALYIQDLSVFIRDSRCEMLCFLPRLIAKFGVNPGKAFFDWYGKCLAVKTQDVDITFQQVYERFGTELCVVVLNMNTGREEYCHPKTTPNMTVRVAVRMSISVPGVLQPIPLHHTNREPDLYIDGGIICNYPIYVFDGWWLSMQPEHHLYCRRCPTLPDLNTRNPLTNLYDISSRFGPSNPRTLGFKQTVNPDLFNDSIIHSVFKDDLTTPWKPWHRTHSRPNTKLVKKRKEQLSRRDRASEKLSQQRAAVAYLIDAIHKSCNSNHQIVKDQLIAALSGKQNEFAECELFGIFGEDVAIATLVETAPTTDNSNLISPGDLDTHFRKFGLDIYKSLETSSVPRESLRNVTNFSAKLQRNVTNAARRSFVKPEDLQRTVNIHTDYIEFLDFELCMKDKEFLIQQGYRETLVFLQNYASKHNVLPSQQAPPEQPSRQTPLKQPSQQEPPDQPPLKKSLEHIPSPQVFLKQPLQQELLKQPSQQILPYTADDKPISYLADDADSDDEWHCALSADSIELS